jgi:hypothetical protein
MDIERVSGDSNFVEVLDRVLDKGIDLIAVQARVVVASLETDQQFTEAVAGGSESDA